MAPAGGSACRLDHPRSAMQSCFYPHPITNCPRPGPASTSTSSITPCAHCRFSVGQLSTTSRMSPSRTPTRRLGSGKRDGGGGGGAPGVRGAEPGERSDESVLASGARPRPAGASHTPAQPRVTAGHPHLIAAKSMQGTVSVPSMSDGGEWGGGGVVAVGRRAARRLTPTPTPPPHCRTSCPAMRTKHDAPHDRAGTCHAGDTPPGVRRRGQQTGDCPQHGV